MYVVYCVSTLLAEAESVRGVCGGAGKSGEHVSKVPAHISYPAVWFYSDVHDAAVFRRGVYE